METIKVQQYINENDEYSSFRIFRMEEYYANRKGQLTVPHRHNFYTVLIIKEAKGKHLIDFKAYELSGYQIYFVSPGQVHQLIEEDVSVGYAIVFTNHFLVHNDIPECFISDLNLFDTSAETPPLNYTARAASIHQFCEAMLACYLAPSTRYQYQSIGAYLKLLLIECNHLCTLEDSHTQWLETGRTKLQAFKKLLNQHFKEWVSVAKYAEALHITSDHLNRVIKSLTAKSAKEHIQERRLVEAKRLLYFSEASAKEIAYELGFSEPAHFSQFFKYYTGIAPSKFRQKSVG